MDRVERCISKNLNLRHGEDFGWPCAFVHGRGEEGFTLRPLQISLQNTRGRLSLVGIFDWRATIDCCALTQKLGCANAFYTATNDPRRVGAPSGLRLIEFAVLF